MHEFGMVDEFIEKLFEVFKDRRKTPREVIRVGFGPGLVEDSLRQAFDVHTRATSLSDVHFEFIKKKVAIPCECGTMVKEPKVDAHIPYTVCETCQRVLPIPDFNVLELIDVL